jgi:glycosyltransferase involved in cell wall biosynthesis
MALSSDAATTSTTKDVAVVIPVKNGESMIGDCLASVVQSDPGEVLVVDGASDDNTLEVACRFPVRILSDDGQGLGVARTLGVQAASCPLVAFVDADVVLPDGALASLLAEFLAGGYVGLQAGLHSTSPGGYWGRALVSHHQHGRSQHWFGVVATIFQRDTLLADGLDPAFHSGEDFELRLRLQRKGARIGVSESTVVTHRFDDTFRFARSQWIGDGHGLARVISKSGPSSAGLIGLPLGSALRGAALSLARGEPEWLPYYACYLTFQYFGMLDYTFRAAQRWVTNQTRSPRRT